MKLKFILTFSFCLGKKSVFGKLGNCFHLYLRLCFYYLGLAGCKLGVDIVPFKGTNFCSLVFAFLLQFASFKKVKARIFGKQMRDMSLES